MFPPMNRSLTLLRRIRILTWLFIFGLFLSGATAMPLVMEVSWGIHHGGATYLPYLPTDVGRWLEIVQIALESTQENYPFLFYGTDWLAFGHFVIAIAFIGALRDPVRNRWLFDFGLIACALVIPYALICGGLRGIPIWWRLIDCSFGVFGAIPLYFCRRWTLELERSNA